MLRTTKSLRITMCMCSALAVVVVVVVVVAVVVSVEVVVLVDVVVIIVVVVVVVVIIVVHTPHSTGQLSRTDAKPVTLHRCFKLNVTEQISESLQTDAAAPTVVVARENVNGVVGGVDARVALAAAFTRAVAAAWPV